jgi:hypothetical protein
MNRFANLYEPAELAIPSANRAPDALAINDPAPRSIRLAPGDFRRSHLAFGRDRG